MSPIYGADISGSLYDDVSAQGPAMRWGTEGRHSLGGSGGRGVGIGLNLAIQYKMLRPSAGPVPAQCCGRLHWMFCLGPGDNHVLSLKVKKERIRVCS